MTWKDEQNTRLAHTGHGLATWSPGDRFGTRYRIVPLGGDYDADRSILPALGKKAATDMVSYFVEGWFRGRDTRRPPQPAG